MNSIAQDMKHRQSLVEHALRHGVTITSRSMNKARSYLYFWFKRYDGTLESLRGES